MDAITDPTFDERGRLQLDTSEFVAKKNADLELLTDQTKVLQHRNEASQKNLHRFRHSKRRKVNVVMSTE